MATAAYAMPDALHVLRDEARHRLTAGALELREISSFAYAHKVGARGTAIKLNCNRYGIKYLST